MSEADGKGGAFDLIGISVDGGQLVVGNIVPNGTDEVDGLAIIDGRDINAATQELVDECLVVIGTHICPAGVVNLTIE